MSALLFMFKDPTEAAQWTKPTRQQISDIRDWCSCSEYQELKSGCVQFKTSGGHKFETLVSAPRPMQYTSANDEIEFVYMLKKYMVERTYWWFDNILPWKKQDLEGWGLSQDEIQTVLMHGKQRKLYELFLECQVMYERIVTKVISEGCKLRGG